MRLMAAAITCTLLAACGRSPAPVLAAHRTIDPSIVPSISALSPTASVSPSSKLMAACTYAFPVRPASVVHYGSAHHDYPATDIFAPLGTDVVAATDGVVDYVSTVDRWDPKVDDPATRGGLSEAIIGRDGVRYYGSHLRDLVARIRPGAAVTAGESIGHVGSTGNARGISPHLHFGISHPTFPDDWQVRRGEVSPFAYLNAWRTGRNVTPVVKGARPSTC